MCHDMVYEDNRVVSKVDTGCSDLPWLPADTVISRVDTGATTCQQVIQELVTYLCCLLTEWS